MRPVHKQGHADRFADYCVGLLSAEGRKAAGGGDGAGANRGATPIAAALCGPGAARRAGTASGVDRGQGHWVDLSSVSTDSSSSTTPVTSRLHSPDQQYQS